MAGKLWRIDGGDRAGRALSTILGMQTLRYWLLGSWALAIAVVAGALPALIWLAVSVLAGMARGRYEANLAERGVTGAQFTAVATASSAIWAVGPAIAYVSGGAAGAMVAVCLLLCGSILVATQFRDMPRRALLVSSPYAVAGFAFTFTSSVAIAWAFLACGFASALALYANILFGARHRAQIERYEAEQRRLILELETARDRADAANQAKSAFLAMISHELRTPMNGVLGAAQLLHETPLAPQQKTFVELIQTSGDSLLCLLNDILDFAKIEAGRLDLEAIETPLKVTLERVAAIWEAKARTKDLNYRIDISPDAPDVIVGDPTRLSQVVHNLLSNALKFTEAGAVALVVKSQRLADDRARIAIEVHDTGPGISEEGQARLFSAFTQLDASTTRRFGGTGLGLAISRRLAEMMGGELSVSSEVGAGSTFTLAFEAEVAAWRGGAGQVQAAEEAIQRPLRVLVVEDHAVNRQILDIWLSSRGHSATMAENGQVALEIAAAQAFDLVLMDVNMPVLDGLSAVRRLRQSPGPNHNAPMVMLSASARAEDHQAGFDAGADAYLNKPIDFAALGSLLAEVGRAVPEAAVEAA
ncbi:MAG: response regulator [Caulobacteraceae bacterium]|nr:response regulator [Caulobacteraceae bacterium]